jgi:hypothetical protein
MDRNAIQFRVLLCVTEFQKLYGTGTSEKKTGLGLVGLAASISKAEKELVLGWSAVTG